MGDRNKAVKDVAKAFESAVLSAGLSASVRTSMGERVDASGMGRDILTGTVSTYLINHAKTALCSKGYAASVTCERSGNQLNYFFDVNRRRVVVGVQFSF